MPKRSNSFQQAIHFIYSQLESEGAIVTESTLLLETNIQNPIKREVDILIEKELGDTKLKLAVECRGRARKDSLEWIDGLIGKYLNLPVDRVIAVSESGFTRNAILVAKRHKIELLSLRQVHERNWSVEFQKLSVAKIVSCLELYRTSFETNPPFKNILGLKDTIYSRTGEEHYISVEDSINKYFLPALEKILYKYIQDHFSEIYTPLSNLHKPTLFEKRVPCKNIFLVDANREEYDIKSITFHMRVNWKFTKSDIKHKSFGEEALITTGIVETKGNRNKIRVVQIKDKGTIKLFTEKLQGHTKQD